jgi:hypothetical protein
MARDALSATAIESALIDQELENEKTSEARPDRRVDRGMADGGKGGYHLAGPLTPPWSGQAFRQRCVTWHWAGNAKPIDNPDWADEDAACGSLWRHEHHCLEQPDQPFC